jgi:hypothetical protein
MAGNQRGWQRQLCGTGSLSVVKAGRCQVQKALTLSPCR